MKPESKSGTVTLLLDHGEGNVGDQAMLLSVLCDLRRAFDGHARFCVASPSAEYAPFLDERADVERVASPNLCCRLSWRPLLAVLDRGWRWGWRSRAERRLRPRRARQLCRRLVAGGAGGADDPRTRLAEALARSDAVHIVGGGYFNDLWAHSMVWPKWALVRAAHQLGKPVFITGQGIGPLEQAGTRRAVREIVAASELFTLREQRRSPGLLEEIGCPPGTFGFAGDDTLTLEPAARDAVAAFLERSGVAAPDEYLCASVRFASYTGDYLGEIQTIAGFLDRLIDAAGLPLVFTSMSEIEGCDDAVSARRVVEQMARADRCVVIDAAPPPAVAKALPAGARVCVALSYHFALFALSSGVPVLMPYRGPYYRAKMLGLADAFGVPELAVPLDHLAGAEAPALAERIAGEPDAWVDRLARAGAAMTGAVRDSRRAEAARLQRDATGQGTGT